MATIKPVVIVCDLDGTAANMTGRSPYDYSLVHTDKPNDPVRTTVYMFNKVGYQILYVSGRPGTEECRQASLHWLARHSFPRGELFMRPDGDKRPDNEIKREIYKRDIEPLYKVLLVLDDRNRVVAEWRKMGLTCFQVAEGDF